MAVPVFDAGAEGKVLPWLGRSAAIFHSLRLLVVAVGEFPSALLSCLIFDSHRLNSSKSPSL